MNEVLKNWIEIKLEKICSRITKGGTPTTYGYAFQKEGINFIKVENLNKGTVDLRSISDFISQEAHDFQKKSQLQEGDLLFSIAGTIGETCIVKKEILPANTNQALAIIQGFHKVLTPNFLKFQLDSFVARKVTSKARGGAMNNVSLGDLKNLDVLIPPVPEQRAIVAKIEQLFSELDNGITNLKAAKDKLEIYRQAVLKKAFEGELTKEWREQQSNLPTADELLEQIKEERLKHYENQLTEWEEAVVKWEASGKKGRKLSKPKKIKGLPQLSETDLNGHTTLPASWKWVKLDEVTQRASKVKKESLNPNDIFKYFDIGGIDNKTQRILSFKTYRWKEAPSRAQQIVEFGDTLFSTVRTYLKNIGQVNKREYHNEICSTGFTVIRGIENKINPNFLFYLSTSEFFIQPLNKLQVGTSYPAVKDDDVFNQPFPLCSYAEQNQIVQEIESRLSVCDNILANIEEGLDKSEALRQSILKQAFEGKLLSEEELESCKQEPDWEPAEKLLERIKNRKQAEA